MSNLFPQLLFFLLICYFFFSFGTTTP